MIRDNDGVHSNVNQNYDTTQETPTLIHISRAGALSFVDYFPVDLLTGSCSPQGVRADSIADLWTLKL